MCRLFWAVINKYSSAGVVQHCLDDWNIDIEPNDKLNLVMNLQTPVPDNLANIRADGLNTDEFQRIDITVNKKTRRLQDEPVTHFGSASISVPPSMSITNKLHRNLQCIQPELYLAQVQSPQENSEDETLSSLRNLESALIRS